MQDCIPK
jgi:hypothetical protein